MLEINLSKLKFWTVIILIQIISFATGVFAGKTYFTSHPKNSNLPNYNINQPDSQTQEVSQNQSKTSNQTKSTICNIKGNISGKSKIYHLPGGSFYDRTQEEMCFDTELDAQNAGFIKSSR